MRSSGIDRSLRRTRTYDFFRTSQNLRKSGTASSDCGTGNHCLNPKFVQGVKKQLRRERCQRFYKVIYPGTGINVRVGEQELARRGWTKRVSRDRLTLPPRLLD